MKWWLYIGLLLLLFFAQPVSAARIDLQAIADVSVDQLHPTTNTGRSTILEVRARDVMRHTLIKFNAANAIPSGSTINGAYLKLFTYDQSCMSGSEITVKVFRLLSSWSEMTANYNNTPDFSLSNVASRSIPISAPAGYQNWNVTNIVKQWVEQGQPDYGFRMYYYNGSIDCDVSFFAREGGGQMPELSIDYTPPIRNLRDVVPPVISQVNVEHLSTTAVDVHWTTNEPATTLVLFGTGGYYDRSSPAYDTFRTSHIARVDQLTQATTYNYQIISVDAAGNRAVLDNQSFTTARDGSRPHPTVTANAPASSPSPSPQQSGGGPATQLHLQNIISDVTGPATARIKWWSRPPGTSWVFASATAGSNAPITDYELVIGRNQSVETHEVLLQRLSPNTSYGYRVATRTSDNQWVVSERQEFKTYKAPSATPNGGAGTDGDLPPQQYETVYDPDIGDSANGIDSSKAEGEAVRQQVAELLGKEGAPGRSLEEEKPKGSEEASLFKIILWWLWKIWFLLLLLLAAVIALVIWLIKRRKKNKNAQTDVSNTEMVKPENSTEVLPSPRKHTALIVILVFVFVILFWKIFGIFFWPVFTW